MHGVQKIYTEAATPHLVRWITKHKIKINEMTFICGETL